IYAFSGSVNTHLAIYDNNASNQPNNLLAESVTQFTNPGWIYFTLTTNPSLSAGATYWLTMNMGGSGMNVGFNSGISGDSYDVNPFAFGAFPSIFPVGGAITAAHLYSINVSYCVPFTPTNTPTSTPTNTATSTPTPTPTQTNTPCALTVTSGSPVT